MVVVVHGRGEEIRKGTWKVAKVRTTVLLTFYRFYGKKAGSK